MLPFPAPERHHYLWCLEATGSGSKSQLRGSPFPNEETARKFETMATTSPSGGDGIEPYRSPSQ